MASLGQSFDPTAHDTEQKERGDFTDLPNGNYEMEMEKNELVATKNGKGQRLAVQFSVIRPEEFANQKVFESYNLLNESAQAQKIGNEQFAYLTRSIGESGLFDDADILNNRSFTAEVILGKPSADGKYAARNEIKKYFYPDEGNVPKPSISAEQPPVAANENKATATVANDNTQAKQEPAAQAGGKRPWGAK